MSSFRSDVMKELLLSKFGFAEFRPGQEAVIEALATHSAALAVFPTGGGKSLCYQLPALTYDGVTLVVSPLIALMKDQIDFLRSRGISAARIDSSLGSEELRSVHAELEAGTLKLLYVAPERFNNERFLATMHRTRIALFAVDEAHCISEWGHNFRPDYLKLTETARQLGAERVLALTATATPPVVADICESFCIPPEAAVVTGFYRQNLNMCLTPVSAEDRDKLLLKRLLTRRPGPTIVYVTLQKTAERVAELLDREGFQAKAYHAGMETEERTNVQDWWMASDQAIVVATIAFGMGIDKSDVRYVYHYNMPKGLESYSQEIGRAGRDGAKSTVELFACNEDVPTIENFAYGDTPTASAIRGLINEVLAAGPEFDISHYDLSDRHDLRPLVLKTILTYLELLGVLRQGTPYYAGYAVRLLRPEVEIVHQFTGEPADLLRSIFSASKKGTSKGAVCCRLNPDDVAVRLNQQRKRIVRALEVLEQRGLVELSLSEVRQRYSRLNGVPSGSPDVEALVTELTQRFTRREVQTIAGLERVMSLVTLGSCQTNALAAYFGEVREVPCGHCTYCVTGTQGIVPPTAPAEPLPAGINMAELRALRSDNSIALRDSRQLARFLCGLSSPATTRARLTRSPMFGALEHRRFHEVMAWCDRLED